MGKISGPLLDRIDIHIDVPAVNHKEMRAGAEPEGSAQIRERVMRARDIQLRRFSTSTRERIYANAQRPRGSSAHSANSPRSANAYWGEL